MRNRMWILAPVVLASAAIGLGGCVVENTPPPSQPAQPVATSAAGPAAPYQEPPQPTEPPERIQWAAADGRPSELRVGVAESFWVWHDGNGRNWHVRTSTHTYLHHFSGWAMPETGQLTEFHLMRAEMGDYIRLTPRGVAFNYGTQAEEEGFDFQSSGDHCVRFDFKIDGHQNTGRVFIGRNNVHPQHQHFTLCP
jgi:hypothetical protein